MSRALLSGLLCLGLGALSCGAHWQSEAELPRVAAAPPEAVVAAAPADSHDADQIARVRERLERAPTGLGPEELEALATAVVAEAQRHGFTPELVLAVIHVESRFQNFVVSPVGAMGLMQILPSTGHELALRLGLDWRGPGTLFDPVVNVRLGVAYLRRLSDRYGDLATALAAYNWGPGKIDRRIRRGAPLPRKYAQLVLDAYGAKS